MRHLIVAAAFCIIAAGCNGNGNDDPKDAASVYEAVIKEEVKNAKKGEAFYVFVDGKDPAPELLKLFQKQFPELQPGSKAPKGRALRISLEELKFIDRNTAELRGGFSNGMDGRGSRYRLGRKNDAWVIEKVVVEVES